MKTFSDRAAKPWTRAEEDVLALLWGSLDIHELAKRLGRGAPAVRFHAHKLGIGAYSQGSHSLDSLLRESGYARTRILTAARKAGLKLRRIKKSHPEQRTAPARYAITDQQRAAIYKFLASVPDALPHFCKGYCRRCHTKVFPKSKHADDGQWGVRGRADECARCHKSDNLYVAKDLCTTCYDHDRRARAKQRGRTNALQATI